MPLPAVAPSADGIPLAEFTLSGEGLGDDVNADCVASLWDNSSPLAPAPSIAAGLPLVAARGPSTQFTTGACSNRLHDFKTTISPADLVPRRFLANDFLGNLLDDLILPARRPGYGSVPLVLFGECNTYDGITA
jgi:hypothetical protein